jgi:hypothetical protein
MSLFQNLNQKQKNLNMKDIIVSINAEEYFIQNKISSKEWNNHCRVVFNLSNGDHVFYEGNTIGYRRIKKNTF